jgi:hypothetical protein
MITLTEQELLAVSLMIRRLAQWENEDIIGAILKTGAFYCLDNSDEAVVTLSKKLEEINSQIPHTLSKKLEEETF